MRGMKRTPRLIVQSNLLPFCTIAFLLLLCPVKAAVAFVQERRATGFPNDPDLAYFAGDGVADTAVTIQNDVDGKAKFFINGQLTYSDSGAPASSWGMLMNNRMVQATIDDMDGSLNPDWNDAGKPENNFLNAGPWDPRANTERFIASLDVWKSYGVIAHTLNFQGGCQCTGGIGGGNQINELDNNPFGSSGTECFDDWWANVDSQHARYLARMGSVIRAADDRGIVIILGLFYFGQDDSLADETAVWAATDAAVDWIVANGFTNVVLEIGNEASISNWYAHDILKGDQVWKLVDRVHELTDLDGVDDSTGFAKNPGFVFPAGRILTSVSGGGAFQPPATWLQRIDFVLLHGNGVSVNGITSMVNTARNNVASALGGSNYALPIVFNEDDGQSQNGPNLNNRLDNLQASYDAEASWGLYYDYYHQTVYPPRWEPWGNAQDVADHYAFVLGLPDNVPPIADAGSDLASAAGASVNFDGSGSNDPDDGPSALMYDWDFGDGFSVTDAGPTPVHDFLRAGVYTVTLTVHDGVDQDSAYVTVAVGTDVIVRDNFDDGDGGGWDLKGDDSIVDNALVLFNGGVSALTSLGDSGMAGAQLADVRFSATVSMTGAGSGWVGIAIRRTNPSDSSTGSGYLVFIRQNGSVNLFVGGGTGSIANAQTGLNPLFNPVVLAVEAVGSNIKVWTDGTLHIDEDESTFSSGSLAICANSLNATVDNILVSSPLPTHGFGTPETTSGALQATMSSTGTPNVAGPFSIVITGLSPGVTGLLFYGAGAADIPFKIGDWYGWTDGVTRLPVKVADGAGVVTYGVSEIDAVAGSSRTYQFWYRDPGQTDGMAVSNALHVDFE